MPGGAATGPPRLRLSLNQLLTKALVGAKDDLVWVRMLRNR